MNLPARIAEAQLAVMLLTRLPVGKIGQSVPPTAHTIWAFPLVGACLGALGGVVFWAGVSVGLPALVAALLAIAISIVLTGALHEDGLADVADGFGGGRTVARKLEIMRDSRLGSYGAVGLFLVLALIAGSIAESGNMAYFIAIGAVSRSAMLVPMLVLKPARTDGLGHGATIPLDARFGVAALLTAPFIVLAPQPAVFAFIAAFGTVWLARKHIGGQTGDVLGTTQKLAECTAWMTAAAIS